MSTQRPANAWHPRLDVLVVAYNNEAEMAPLLSSLADTLPDQARVLIWSNSAVEPLREAVARADMDGLPEVEVLGDGQNLGFAAACNRLAEVSSAPWVMFLNPDTVVRSLPASLPRSQTILAPVIWDEEGRQQRTYGPERTLAREAGIRLLHRDTRVTAPHEFEEVGFCSGACFLAERERFLEVGGFDTKYFMYYEDLDLCRRWRDVGGSIVVDPEFSITHVGGVSASSNKLLAHQRSFESAARYHSTGGVRTVAFHAVAYIEALVKSMIALVNGRVGSVDRSTQLRFTRWLLSGRRAT